MHVFIYQFFPKAGREAEFVEAWQHVTEGIKKYRGGLGSRLHKDEQGNWIAYAQWPSAAQAEAKMEMPAEHQAWLRKMNETLTSSKRFYSLRSVADLLGGIS